MSPRVARPDGQSARGRAAIKTRNSLFPRKPASSRVQTVWRRVLSESHPGAAIIVKKYSFDYRLSRML
ncbi:MAG: hypothetical protein B6D41_01820 [Chloroflexi bacterium UTCFX4]|nr:MAG: hypothetical protein B6D41_01820 [Chloroflexi bacterium UTCFX4]